MNRRRFIGWLSTAGLAPLLGPSVLHAADAETVTDAALAKAGRLLGLDFDDAERELMRKSVEEHLESYEKLRELPLGNEVQPALLFSPLLPGASVPAAGEKKSSPRKRFSKKSLARLLREPAGPAFHSLRELGALLREGKLSSVELTRRYLERLKRFDAELHCVITLTEERAMRLARRADEELARGVDRGPLHGIPWGAKDLIAARGYRTTWGAMPFKDQVIDLDAAVVEKLDAAGAVLTAKLSVGALAWGDVWFGGTTRNPWNTEQGSSGSSAGPAAATVAGLVGFSVGTETLGSIISPSQRCGATGLRPTFGRVSRYGTMALSWSMDKLGPICRSVEDCALVLEAIHGADGRDASAIDAPFVWNADRDPATLRLGFDREAFEEESPDRPYDQSALRNLRGMGLTLHPVSLPKLPVGDMLIILDAEAGAAFDDLTRSNRDDQLVRQIEQAWPNVFRAARFIPAVEYIQANRARRLLMERFEAMMREVDVYVHPTYGGSTLLAANLTGHPTVVVPNGFRGDGTPASISFTGGLFREAELLAVAKAYQDRTGYHRSHPPLFSGS